MNNQKVMEVYDLVKEKNDHATIITTAIQDLDSENLVNVLESKISLKEDLAKEMAYVHEHEDDECCCGHHHHDDDDDEDECCCHHEHHHHDDDDDDECCCHHEHHHHDDDDDDECCCHHEHHHHDDDDNDECCCHHEHHHHDDDDDDECCCHHEHHHHDDDDDDDECCCHHEHEHHHHHHHADEVFTSWGKETPKAVSYEFLDNFLQTLANDESLGIIVRSKGILKASDNDKWYYYDFVSGDYEIRLGEPEYTGKIVVIGSKMDEHKIEHLFFGE